MWKHAILCLAPALLLAGCPGGGQQQSSGTPPAPAETASTGGTSSAPPPAIKQLVLIYTGDTLSGMQTVINNDEAGTTLRLGGLSALTAEIISYKQNITAMARQRVLDSGGNADSIRADDELGLLGEHPYLLLDYGGWERDGDPHGGPYVELMLRMYRDLKYNAVGSKLYQRLPTDYWQSYAAYSAPQVLVSSAGAARPEALATVPVLTCEVHGALWGIASVPLPPDSDPDPFVRIEEYVEQAAAQLEASGARHWILLCSGGPKRLYEKLRTDARFTVVIGVSPPGLAEPQGFGKIRADGPVMLPELNMGGQELATCHLIYPADGDSPAEFNFTRRVVQDDMQSPFPYRNQVSEAIHARQALADKARK